MKRVALEGKRTSHGGLANEYMKKKTKVKLVQRWSDGDVNIQLLLKFSRWMGEGDLMEGETEVGKTEDAEENFKRDGRMRHIGGEDTGAGWENMCETEDVQEKFHDGWDLKRAFKGGSNVDGNMTEKLRM